VIFSIDAPFPSEVDKCTQLYGGETQSPPTVDGVLLREQLNKMQIRFVQRDWPTLDGLPFEGRSRVDAFIHFLTHNLAGLNAQEISNQLYAQFSNTGDASYVDLEELE
jgi:hypothetical protein